MLNDHAAGTAPPDLARNWPMRVLLFMLVMGGGLSIGILTAPGAWYSALVKPDFNPPNWVFGPVWTALYAVISLVGWRQFEARHAGGQWSLWRLQLG